MTKISRRGFFQSIPAKTVAGTAIAGVAVAQSVVRTNKVQYYAGLQCKCGMHMVGVGHWLADDAPEYLEPNSSFCCNPDCELFHVPFEMPKIEVTEVRPVRYAR